MQPSDQSHVLGVKTVIFLLLFFYLPAGGRGNIQLKVVNIAKQLRAIPTIPNLGVGLRLRLRSPVILT